MADKPIILTGHANLSVPNGIEVREIPSFPGGKYVAGSDGHIYCYSDARVNSKKTKTVSPLRDNWVLWLPVRRGY